MPQQGETNDKRNNRRVDDGGRSGGSGGLVDLAGVATAARAGPADLARVAHESARVG